MRRVIYLLVWLIAAVFAFVGASNFRTVLRNVGAIQDEVTVAGTGSMYPTFPKGTGNSDIVRSKEIVAWPQMRSYPGGINFLGFSIGMYTLARGDIVDFENKVTDQITKKQYGEPAGFIKRIIAMPSDILEIRDGFVYVNSKILKEPYTASPRSTFGGSFLSDCQKVTIPPNKVFVMGDNRKGSLDSRFDIGLVDFSDIRHVLPLALQKPYEKNWREAENDETQKYQAQLNSDEFISILNQKRKENAVKSLKFSDTLVRSARKRAEIMLKTDDFSIEASRSGYTLEKSIADAGYENVLFAETLARGYYNAEELLDNLLAFPETKKLALNGQYEDVGLSAVVGDVNNCPVQAVVVHFGGYEPPNYSQKDIESWQRLVNSLNSVIPSWERLRNKESVNQESLSKLLDSFYRRRSNAEKILSKLRNNLWLSKTEREMAQQDKILSAEQETLIERLK